PWQLSTSGVSGSGHTGKTEYSTNTASGDRSVRLYRAETVTTAGQQHQRTLSTSGNYAASQLYLTITKDENWTSGKTGTTEEYKDKEGQVVLKRTWKDESTPYSTYYVYDDFGNLSFVLPPGAEPDNGGIDATKLNKYCYQYRYDGRNRLIEKRIPGKDGWESTVYNTIDQAVLTQDPKQAQNGKWTFTKYDGLGRVVMSGEYASSVSRASLQTTVNAQAFNWENYVGGTAGEGYTNQSFPTSSTPFTVNYYDGYTFPGSTTFGPLPVARSPKTHSLLTGTRIKVLGTTTMLTSLTFYDEDGRVMQVKSQNYRDGVDSVLTTYTFTGEPDTVTRYHTSPGSSVTTRTRYAYDHMGRKTKTWENINNAGEVLLSENEYNETGQLWKKKLHNGAQTITYTYNE
ncbi:sugar-binding protein, partial [Pararcticibacter amylolyticus]